MTLVPGTIPGGHGATLARRSTLLFHWDGADGALDARTGQAGTLTRAATGTAVDAAGTTYTAAHHAPRWEARDVGSGLRDALGLRLTADDLTWAFAPVPRALTLYVAFDEVATRTVNGAGLVYLGNDGVSGGRLVLDATGTNYRVTYHNGSASRSSTLATGSPAADAYAELRATLAADGVVQLGLSVNGADEVVAGASAALGLVSAWGAGARLRVNRTGSAGTQGSTWLRRLKIAAGVHDLATMRARR